METDRVRLQPTDAHYEGAILDAARRLREGQLVAFPTETAYAVAANAANADAVRRLRQLKQDPEPASFSLHVARLDDARPYVGRLSRLALRFMSRAWPGPLTLVFPVAELEFADSDATATATLPVDPRKSLPAEATELLYGSEGLTLRCPDQDAALGLLHYAEVPVIGTGASRSGRQPPRDPETAFEELTGRVDLLLDVGECRYTKPSTIVRIRGEQWDLLRAGVVEERVLRQLSSTLVLFVCTGNTCRSPMAEGLFRHLLAKQMGVTPEELSDKGLLVMSAGVMAGHGGAPSEHAVTAVAELGGDIADHRSRPLTPELLLAADRVFTMTAQHADAARRLAPGYIDKIRTLSSETDVADPIGSDLDAYRECANQIRNLLLPLVQDVAS